MPLRPAVFFDRDDTLIVNRAVTASSPYPGSLFDPALVQLMPGAADACGALRRAGFALVIVTNQGAVARGHCTLAQVDATNTRLREVLRTQGGPDLDALYLCPYHPDGSVAPYNAEHPWRKPAPGMLLAAAADLGLDLARSWMIGDAPRDIEAALAAGIPLSQTILLGDSPAKAGHRISDLSQAVQIILHK